MIERWSESPGDAEAHMAEEILVDLREIVRRHPWWRARAALSLNLLNRRRIAPPSTILDAGCGWGVTLHVLEHAGYRVTGVDISRQTLEMLEHEKPCRSLAEVDLTQPILQSAAIGAFDAVLALDVIEHIDDDQAAIRRLSEFLKPGGTLIVSVPALPDFYTEFDAIQGHRRRYLPSTLRKAFDGASLELEQVFYWGRWLVPALKSQRTRRRSLPGESPAEVYRKYLTIPPWPISWIARLAFTVEQPLAVRSLLHTGSSLFAVAKKS